MDDAGQPPPHRAADHQLDAARVRLLDEARRRPAKVDERCRMHDPVAASKGLVDRGCVRHVADDYVVRDAGDQAIGFEGGAHFRGVAHQEPHFMAGSDQRPHGVRAGETRASGDEHLHRVLLSRRPRH